MNQSNVAEKTIYTIYKYHLDIIGRPFPVMMSEGARILSFKMNNGDFVVWALVKVDAPMVERWLSLVGTGHPCNFAEDDGVEYVGTVQNNSEIGTLVWHLFDRGEK